MPCTHEAQRTSMLVRTGWTRQLRATAAPMAASTQREFRLGIVPGCAASNSETARFGGVLMLVGQPAAEKSFDRLAIWACTSKPMTTSHMPRAPRKSLSPATHISAAARLWAFQGAESRSGNYVPNHKPEAKSCRQCLFSRVCSCDSTVGSVYVENAARQTVRIRQLLQTRPPGFRKTGRAAATVRQRE